MYVKGMKVRIGIIALLISLTLSGNTRPSGKIAGRVYDASTRTPLFGVAVSVHDEGLGSYTDKNGVFIITDIPAGTYSVEASMISYRTQVKTSVVVEPGRTTEVVFKLTQGSVDVEGVTVRPDYFPKVRDAPVSERSFSAEEIQVQPGGAVDVQRVVQALPSVVSPNDQNNEIIVRGASPNENLFLVDGIEFAYPNHFGSADVQGGAINMLNPLVIREAEFIAGAFPARYGDRVSSVMDISLRRGTVNEFDGKVDMGIGGLGAVVEGPLPGRVGSFLGSFHKSFMELMARAGFWQNMDAVPYYTNGLGKINFNLGPSNELSVLFLAGSDDIEIDLEEMVYMPWTSHMKSTQLASGIGWQMLFGQKGYGKLTLYHSDNYWESHQYMTDDRSDTTYSSTSMAQVWGARYDASLRWLEGQETETGFSYNFEPFSYSVYYEPDTLRYYFYNPEDTNQIDSSVVATDPETGEAIVNFQDSRDSASSSKLTGYLQHRIRLADFAHLTLGLRGDYLAYTGNFYLSPRLGLSTEPLIAGFSFNAGYGWHYQSPPYYVLASDTANSLLEHKRSDHYVLGIERLLTDDIKLSVEAYYKDTRNVPIPCEWSPNPYVPRTRYYDYGKSRAKGIEVLVQKKYANNWHGTLAYSFGDVKTTNPYDTSQMMPGDYDYRHVFTAVAAYKFEFYKYDWYKKLPDWFKYTIGAVFLSDESNLGFRFRYTGGNPYTPMRWDRDTRTWIAKGEVLNSERYPAYDRLDLRWDHKYRFRKFSCSWYIDILNVYAKENFLQNLYLDDETVAELHQIGFFPTGGFVIEF